jgi:hypothetical protein
MATPPAQVGIRIRRRTEQPASTPGPIRSTPSLYPNVLCSREVAGAVTTVLWTATSGRGRCHPLES